MNEPTPEMVSAARKVVQSRHRVISTLDLVDIIAAARAVDPLRQADTVPGTAADRDAVVNALAAVIADGHTLTWQMQAERVLTHLQHPARANADA